MKTYRSIIFFLLFLCVIATGIALLVIFLTPQANIKPLNGIQQGALLIPSDATNNAQVGDSVALNFNGNIMVTGGSSATSAAGAAWIYVRSGTVWSQQTTKLIGSGSSGNAHQGQSVAIASVEGKTMLSGGYRDNTSIGATWVFVQQSDQTWIQQGTKLVASDSSGSLVYQGQSVALSSDGNTALIGGIGDNSGIGASWIFVRVNGIWTQQGTKLVGTGYSGSDIAQGFSVALSSDGNTALIGGPDDNSLIGASWIFTRSNQTWTQQGTKLLGSGALGNGQQGSSVSLSGDGNTVMIGAPEDNSNVGAVWVFVRSNNVWSQQGNKLIASGGTTGDLFGSAVSLDQDGNTAVISAEGVNGTGAFYIFVRTNQTTWNQVGSAKFATGVASTPNVGSSIAISSDGSTAAVGALLSGVGTTGAVAIFV